jgi:isoquinoline 1-oxidoreductase subunit beta
MHRRAFLSWSAGGGLALALAPLHAVAEGKPFSPWITLHPDGRVTLVTTALEMGQGSRTGQAQVLADELCVAWESVEVVQAPEAEPYLMDGALYSGGSETLRTRWDLLRRAGASVRWQLREAAARRWSVAPDACHAAIGRVTHAASGRSFSYGELAEAAAAIQPPPAPTLKTPAERRLIGKPVSTLAQDEKLNGQARYGIDFRLPGMLFATVRQTPVAGGTLSSVDESPALAVRGVRKVVRLKDAVAVVADSTWAAFKGARALEPRWTLPPGLGSAEISGKLSAALDAPDAVVSPRTGGAEARARLRAAYAAAPRKHEAAYEIAYLAHAPLEPMNATARAHADGRVELWAPCQSPTWCRDDVADMTGLAKDRIVIHPLLMGGGFGRRLKGDYAGRAAQVALQVDAPVQVVWTREEDFTHDVYRPAMRMSLRAALPAEGALTGYEVLAATADDRTGGSGPAPYELKDYAATLATVKAGVPIGAWRSVDPGMALFAKESFIDECAQLAGADPLAYRLQLLGGNTRARRVLQAAARRIGWDAPREKGVGRGFALLQEWDSVVAHAIQVRVEGRRLKVERIVAVVDCGTAVNPQQVRAQFEGGGLMGLSAALGEAMTFTAGRADQTNFDAYKVLRMAQAPQVEVVILETPDAKLGGVGEPPVPGIAPALANALFQATGERVRRLPFSAAGFEV